MQDAKLAWLAGIIDGEGCFLFLDALTNLKMEI